MLTIKKAAAALGVSTHTVRNYIRNGSLTVVDLNPNGKYRAYRIPLSSIKARMEGVTNESGTELAPSPAR